MIAPDKKNIRRLRRRVRAVIKADPALRRARKRMQSGSRRQYDWSTLRVFAPPAVIIAILANKQYYFVGTLLVLWSLVVTLYRAGQISTALHTPQGLWIFYQLPVSNAEVFRHQARRLAFSSMWLGIDWLAFGFATASNTGRAAAWPGALLLAVAQWATAFGLAATLTRWRPKLPYGVAASAIGFGSFVILQFESAQAHASTYLASVLNSLMKATPAGWLAQGFEQILSGSGVQGWLVLLIAAVASVALLWACATALRNAFRIETVFGYDDHDSVGASDWVADSEEPVGSNKERDTLASDPLPPVVEPPPINPAAVAAILHQELERPAGLVLFERGWLERIIIRLLTQRQRVLIDFLRPSGLNWSHGWLIALALLMVAQILRMIGTAGDWTAGLAVMGLAFFALPTFGGRWLGFEPAGAFQTRVGLYSFVPVNFFEIARMMLLVNTLRCVVALPLVLLVSRSCFAPAPLPWGNVLDWALRALAVMLAVQPVWVVGAFSKHSNDSSARWWFTLLIAFVLIVGVLAGGSLGVALFAVDRPTSAFLCGVTLLLLTHGALMFYGWAWGRGVFDLVANPQRR